MSLQNFLSWKDLEFDFPQGVTLIEGFNYDDNSPEGCGKSAILNGLTWVVFGEIPKDIKVHQVIREGEKKAEGTILFDSGHKIIRTRTKSTGTLEFILPDGTPHLGKDIKETQTYIDEFMGMTYETFLQSVYFAQNYGVKFITSDEKTRVKVLSDIAELRVFDKGVKEVTDMLKLEKKSLQDLKTDLAGAEHEVDRQSEFLEKLQTFKEEAIKEKEDKIKNLNDKLVSKAEECEKLLQKSERLDSEELGAGINETQLELENCEETLESLIKELSSSDTVKAELNSVTKEIKRLNSELSTLTTTSIPRAEKSIKSAEDKYHRQKTDLETDIRIHGNEIEELVGKLENPEQENCPTCGQELGEEHLAKSLAVLEKQLNEAARLKEKAEKGLETAKEDFESSKVEAENQRKELQRKAEDLQADLEEAEKVQAEIKIPDNQALEKKIEARKTEKKRLIQDIKDLEGALKDIELYTKQYNKAVEELEEIGAELEEVEAKETGKFDDDIKDAKNKLKDAESECKQLKSLLLEKETYISDLTSLREGFKETKAYTFKALLRDLTNKANYYLGQLFDLPINIEFTNETDDGGVAKISDIVTIGDHERPFALYSGGQSRRIQLAVDLALSDIVASRGDKPISLLVMDEYCKDLSENSMEKVLELFESLDKTVLLIEHNSIIKNIVNNTIEIELRDGVSRCL